MSQDPVEEQHRENLVDDAPHHQLMDLRTYGLLVLAIVLASWVVQGGIDVAEHFTGPEASTHRGDSDHGCLRQHEAARRQRALDQSRDLYYADSVYAVPNC